ncbi:MAG: type II toxin-antitoxin system VapC family toxin [Planctomycetes bacterium]|nr:type II toxin-antitoxin system VapC family toxin [Planctomycetota bacterium]
MKYVLDSSIAFKWEVPETDSDKANVLREDFRNAVHAFLAPDFLPLELAHALTRAERQGRIAVGQANLLWTDAMTTPPILLPSLPLAIRAITISSQLRIGVYDCLYVALAEREKCDFITADDKLVSNVLTQFPFVRPLSTL